MLAVQGEELFWLDDRLVWPFIRRAVFVSGNF